MRRHSYKFTQRLCRADLSVTEIILCKMKFRKISFRKKGSSKIFVVRIYRSKFENNFCFSISYTVIPLELFIRRVLFHRDLYWKA